MESTPERTRFGAGARHPVAAAQPPRLRATSAAVLAGIGHGGTFLALGAGSVWLAATGGDALPLVHKLFVGGLYLQVLPAAGFAVVARHLARYGRPTAAAAAAGLSLVSVLLLGVGGLQALGGGFVQTAFLAVALVLVTALGLGVLTSRMAHAVKHRFEAEPLIAVEPELRR